MKKLLNTKFIAFALLLAAAAAFGTFYISGDLEANDPSSVKVTLYKAEFYADKNSSPVLVSNTPTGVLVDLVQNPGDAFGQGTVEAGSYKRIKLSVENQILFSEFAIGNCGTGPLTDEPMLIDGALASTAIVDLYFATPDDGGQSGWTANGSADVPFLMQKAIEVVAGATTDVDLRFQTAGKLYCDAGGAPKLLPPTVEVLYTVSAPPPAGVCTDAAVAGEFFFYHYAMRGSIYNSATGEKWVNPSLGDIIRSSDVVSGWGTMMINAPTSGTGTWGVYMTNVYNATSNPGMAEHRHRLASWTNTTGNDNEGYFPSVSSGPADMIMGGTYTKSGQRMTFYFPEGGSFQGAVNPTCDIFAGVSLTGGDNDFIYAVKKGDFSSYGGSVLTAFPNKTLVMVQPQMELQYEPSSLEGVVNTTFMYFGTDFAALSTTENKYVGWRSSNQLQPAWVGSNWDYSSWEARRPSERAEAEVGIFNVITLGDDGELHMPGNDSFVAFGGSGTGIIAGSTEEYNPQWGNHRLTAGIIFPVNDAPSMTDLVGTWSLSMLESHVQNTTAWNTPDNANMEFYIQYGDITVNSADTPAGVRNGVANFFGINALTGEVLNSPGGEFFIYGPVTECYDDPAGAVQTIYPTTCPGPAISVPVFLINGVDKSGVEESPGPSVKIALDDAKGAIAIWSPADLSGTIESERNDGCFDGANWGGDGTPPGQQCQDWDGQSTCDSNVTEPADPDYCVLSDPSSRNTFGVGIKILK